MHSSMQYIYVLLLIITEVFLFCLQELSKAFEDDARDNRKTQLLLSATVAAFRPTINRAYEVNKITP